jgi:hypothetical protein
MFRGRSWDKYQVVSTTKGFDSIIEHILIEDPDFSDVDALTKQIEAKTIKFIEDVADYNLDNLSKGGFLLYSCARLEN